MLLTMAVSVVGWRELVTPNLAFAMTSNTLEHAALWAMTARKFLVLTYEWALV